MNRQFRINQVDGTISPTTVHNLDILAFFTNDEKSTLQAMQLLQIEFHSYNADPKSWHFSDVTMSVINAVSKRAAQVYSCGLVALIMAHLNEDGSPASLNEASRLASELAYRFEKIAFKVPKANRWAFQEKAIVGDEATIKNNFRRYRPAAHICAAKTLIGAPNGPSHPMAQPLPKTLTLVSTVLHYQRLFNSWPQSEDWNLIEVWHDGEPFEANYPAVSIPDEFVKQVRDMR